MVMAWSPAPPLLASIDDAFVLDGASAAGGKGDGDGVVARAAAVGVDGFQGRPATDRDVLVGSGLIESHLRVGRNIDIVLRRKPVNGSSGKQKGEWEDGGSEV